VIAFQHLEICVEETTN